MTLIDWLVIIVVLGGIILYGLYKSRTTRNLEGYFLSNRNMPWYVVLLSIMGTQASAITFISGPGQAFADGMRFVQAYFGLPLAMVVICITFVPIYNRLKVYTAYEFLEKRFDGKTRTFTSFLFLLQRGLSTGISIYAPSIIVSSLFGWPVFWINIIMGGLLIIYTVSGGAKAVAHTQKIQLLIILSAMTAAGFMVIHLLPENVGFTDALHISGKAEKTNVITTGITETGFNWNDRFNLLSGIVGGFFLQLSYFGTDHSQVGRYLTAQNNRESRLGLLINGLVKVPMQFGILLIGVLVFAFYQFAPAPISFDEALLKEINNTTFKDSVVQMQAGYDSINQQKREAATLYLAAQDDVQRDTAISRFQALNQRGETYRNHFRQLSQKAVNKKGEDANFVFLSFVKNYLPQGLKGLLLAIIFLAAWGSIAAALNSLAASTVVDFHQRFGAEENADAAYRTAKWYTLGWGVFCILVAEFAHNLGQSPIETVNILGSLFYGVILGIFLVAFYLKKIKGTATFLAALVVELFIIALFFKKYIPFLQQLPDISFLWLNAIGAIGVLIMALLLQLLLRSNEKEEVPA